MLLLVPLPTANKRPWLGYAEAEQLLEQLLAAEVDSPKFDQLLQQAVEAVNHHVEEEETKVLPGISERLSESRRAELAEAFATARMEHLGDRPGQASTEELLQQAENVGMAGVASKSKEELRQALQEQAQQASE